MEEPKVPVRVVVCAANKYQTAEGEPFLVLGPRHGDTVMVQSILALRDAGVITRTDCSGLNQGFVDQWGTYMDRIEALAVATAANQVNTRRPKHAGDWLCSEDLY